MHPAIYRPLLFGLLELARLISGHTPGILRIFGLFTFGLMCLVGPASVSGGEVTIAWDRSQDASVAGYKLYYGHEEGSYDGVVDVGMETTYTLTELEEGQIYYFSLVAYDSQGEESELSQQIAYNGPASDSEADEIDFPDQNEADTAEVNSESVWEEAGEIAVEPDAMPILEQEIEDERDHDDSQASPGLRVIPSSELRIVSVDSETLAGDGAADSAIDGRAETFWHTQKGVRPSVHPHEIVIALAGEYTVGGFRYLPRQDGQTDGMVGRYSFYVSEDGEDWGKPVATGTFSREKTEQEVTFPGQEGAFVRFVAHTEVNGNPWTSVAEIKVLEVQ
jgi:hypothetical protein